MVDQILKFGVATHELKDGSLLVHITDEAASRLGLKIGDRLVWTIGDDGVSVLKRTKRYRLRENEFESILEAASETQECDLELKEIT